jgi:uncharacterized protein (DUF697 family)
MNTFILRGKNTSENYTVNVPFSDMLLLGETIVSLVVTISVFSGDDPTPSNVLSGSPTTDSTNTIAIFTLTAGVEGVTYIVSVLATGSSTSVALKEGYLSIVPTNPF